MRRPAPARRSADVAQSGSAEVCQLWTFVPTWLPDPSNASFFSTSWLASSNPGDTGTVTLRAVDLEGVATEIAARYHVIASGD
jgi:hypothetical protein